LKDSTKRIIIYSLLTVTVLIFYLLFDRFRWKNYSTKNEGSGYTFYSNLSEDQLGEYADLYESFRSYFKSEYGITSKKRLKAYLFESTDSYYQYVRGLGRLVPDTPFGFYITRFALIISNCETGLGTVTHEFSHHLIYDTPIERFPWLKEGFSAYFEKFIGIRNSDGSITLSFGYFSPWRYQEALFFKSKGLAGLEALFEAKTPEVVQSLARNFILFAHEKNKLSKLIQNVYIYNNSKDLIEKSFSSSLTKIEEDWHRWMNASRYNPDIFLVESSRVYSADELNLHSPPLVWDPKRNKYIFTRDLD